MLVQCMHTEKWCSLKNFDVGHIVNGPYSHTVKCSKKHEMKIVVAVQSFSRVAPLNNDHVPCPQKRLAHMIPRE